MTPGDVQELFRTRLGLRLAHSMAAYVLTRFEAAGVPSIAVIAADARTGMPLRASINRDALSSETPGSFQPIVAASTHPMPNP